MNWLKRILWLFAWSVWLWLGFGLYRELPRKPGRLVCELTFKRFFDTPLGFIGDTNHFAVFRGTMRRGDKSIEVFDCDSGRRLQHIPVSDLIVDERGFPQFSKAHGIVIVREFGMRRTAAADIGGFSVIDLKSGERRRMTVVALFESVVHVEKPWLAFVESRPGFSPRLQLVVYDFVADKRILVRPDTPEARIVERPFFIPKSSTLVVSTRSKLAKNLDEVQFEIWNLEGEPVLEKVAPGLRVGSSPSVSANRRIAFGDPSPRSTHVFGIDEGRLLFSDAELLDLPVGQTRPHGTSVGVDISECGRFVMGTSPLSLWEVDSGRELRPSRDFEFASGLGDGKRFVVHEQWSKAWTKGLSKQDFSTRALRRLETQELIHRVDESQWMHPTTWNASKTLGVMPDGSVHCLPYVVNWPLLAICQTILALPLVLLWVVLRWRRKRRPMLQRGAQSLSQTTGDVN
jgi:hypothetical protein